VPGLAEGIVSGNDLPPISGNFGDHLLHPSFQRFELDQIRFGVGVVDVLASWIGVVQTVANIAT
jgi:hypothetical protein